MTKKKFDCMKTAGETRFVTLYFLKLVGRYLPKSKCSCVLPMVRHKICKSVVHLQKTNMSYLQSDIAI